MRSFFYIISALAVIGLAFWSYQENYKTRSSLKAMSQLQHRIGMSRERLAILRTEWAYLNRPERLRELADINYDRLGLLPLSPEQFGKIDQVVFPAPDLAAIVNPVDVSADMETTQ